VLRSFATQPMSPAWSRATSGRSRPCMMERWFSFSAPARVALYTSSPEATDSGAAQAEGTYTLRITAKDASDQAIASTIYVQGLVTGVEQAAGQGLITINGAKAPMSAITSVTQSAAGGSATTTNTNTNTNNTADQTSA